MSDYLIRIIDSTKSIRGFFVNSTIAVREMERIHSPSATSSAAMGRLLTQSFLMGAMMKNETDSLTLKLDGGGPIGLMIAVSNNKGEAKVYASNPFADAESYPNGKLNVKGVVGSEGNLTVISDLGLKEPYIGVSPIVSGEIGEDFAYYYISSEQLPSAVALGVLVDTDLSIISAGGYIIQLMPGVEESTIEKIEKSIKEVEPISSLIEKGMRPEEIAKLVLKDFDIEVIDKKEVAYKCSCSRENVVRMIKSLGPEEIKSMIEEDGGAEVICHFCNMAYIFGEEELNNLL